MNAMGIVPQYQWTHDGDEVLIVRQCGKAGESSRGFVYPLTVGAVVEAPDWNPAPVCGGGLHGWPWGFALGDGAEPDYSGTWLVLAAVPSDVVRCGGKCKVRRATVRYVGVWYGALAMVRAGHIAWTMQAATSGERSSAATSGDGSSAATSGYMSSAATSGYMSSAATSGERSSAATSGSGSSAATSGVRSSAATSGDRSSAATSGVRSSAATSGSGSSAATSGYRSSAATSGAGSSAATSGERSSAATSGERSSAVASGQSSAAVCSGLDSRAKAGLYGCIALAWWNVAEQRAEMRCAQTGPGYLKPHTWYQLDAAGEFVEIDGI